MAHRNEEVTKRLEAKYTEEGYMYALRDNARYQRMCEEPYGICHDPDGAFEYIVDEVDWEIAFGC